MRIFVTLALFVVACAAPVRDPRLYGAWQSNHDLTLAEFRRVPGISSERLEALSSPDLFGHLVTIYRPGDAIVVYEGECTVTSYEVVKRSDDYVDIRYYDSFYGKSVRRRIHFDPGSIWLRVGKAREIFTPADLNKLEAQHSCLGPLLQATR